MKYLKYILLSLVILIPCAAMILIYNDKITQDSPVYYKKGVKLYNEGNWQEAYYNFGKIKKISPLYPAAIFKQAKSAQKAGDYKTAVLKYEQYLQKMPNSIFSRNASLNLAKSYYYLKQYDAAGEKFKKLAAKSSNDGTEEMIFLALAEKKQDKKRAAEYYRRYLNAVLEKTAQTYDYISSAAQELSILEENPSQEDLMLIGKAYFKDRNYNEALKYFSKLPESCCWDYLVLSNQYTGSKTIAKKLIEDGLEKYAASADEDNLREIYNIYASYISGNKFKSRKHIIEKLKEKNIKGLDYVIFKLAQNSSKDKREALYEEICRSFPESRYAPESLWELVLSEYNKGNYKKAERLAVKHLKTFKKVNSTPKTAFWLAKIYRKINREGDADTLFGRIAAKYPDSYYGLRAEALLNKKNNFWQTSSSNQLPVKNIEIEFPAASYDLDLKDLKIINSLFNMGDYEVWLDADLTNQEAESWFEYKKGNKSRSMVLARDAAAAMEIKPHIMSSVYKLAYPVYMAEDINTSGRKLDIDPFLITAVIREESYFNEHAKSRTGAGGLMQLMPATASYMIKKLNMTENADIEDARINLYLGSNYLRYLKNRFDNDLMVIAAYNGGEGAVRRWIRNSNSDDLDEFIENIPYEETRHYVKKVFRTYHMYKKIYK